MPPASSPINTSALCLGTCALSGFTSSRQLKAQSPVSTPNADTPSTDRCSTVLSSRNRSRNLKLGHQYRHWLHRHQHSQGFASSERRTIRWTSHARRAHRDRISNTRGKPCLNGKRKDMDPIPNRQSIVHAPSDVDSVKSVHALPLCYLRPTVFKRTSDTTTIHTSHSITTDPTSPTITP